LCRAHLFAESIVKTSTILVLIGAPMFGLISALAEKPQPAAPPPVAHVAEPVATSSAPEPDYASEARRQHAFDCAVLQDALDEANKATANAQRYGVQQTFSQGMEIERAETTLRNCP
jgi:hypothetical protein